MKAEIGRMRWTSKETSGYGTGLTKSGRVKAVLRDASRSIGSRVAGSAMPRTPAFQNPAGKCSPGTRLLPDHFLTAVLKREERRPALVAGAQQKSGRRATKATGWVHFGEQRIVSVVMRTAADRLPFILCRSEWLDSRAVRWLRWLGVRIYGTRNEAGAECINAPSRQV